MKKNTTLIMAIFVFSFLALSTFAQDAHLTNFKLARYVKTITNYTLSVNVINGSGPNINMLSVSWQLDGAGTVNTYGPIGISGGLPSTGGYYFPVTFASSPLTISTEGAHTVKVWVDATGETNRTNDTITYTFTALENYGAKVVLLEESTAQWCEHCPPAGVVTDSLGQLPGVAVVRFHNTDDLSFTSGQTYYDRYYGGPTHEFFPACEVDMTEAGNYTVNAQYPDWTGDASAQSGISPLALSSVFTVDTGTRQLTATLTANFKYAEAGNYSFNAFLVESGYVGHQTQEDLSVDNNYVHNNIVRAILGGNTGTTGIIPATPATNTDYTKTYTYTIPAGINIQKVNVIGVVFNTDSNNNTAAVNASKTASTTGISNTQVAGSIKVYPNPTTGAVYFNGVQSGYKIEVFDVLGNTIHASVATGDNYSINLSSQSKGMYLYRVSNNTSVVRQGKIILD